MTIKQTSRKPWQQYMIITTQSIVAIYLASFCLALFFLHHGEHWIIPAIVLGLVYLVIVFFSIKRLIMKLPMQVLMIAAPTVPLIILLLIITMFPILQWF